MNDYIFMYVLVASRGGEMRVRILKTIEKEKMNANMLKEKLGIDYKTVTHHLRVLIKHRFIMQIGKKYGAKYEVTNEFLAKRKEKKEIWGKLNKESIGGI
jgi:predicted transcriptional regulator